jgi:hypothetical protein
MPLRRSPRRSAAFLAANRENAQKYTGPRTALGKLRSATYAFALEGVLRPQFWTGGSSDGGPNRLEIRTKPEYLRKYETYKNIAPNADCLGARKARWAAGAAQNSDDSAAVGTASKSRLARQGTEGLVVHGI